MQLPFFYEPDLIDEATLFTLSIDTHKHAIQVLRMKVGDAMHLTNGKGLLCRAIIQSADKKQSIVQIQSVQFFEEKPIKVAIGISLLKNANRLEWFLEKATELGISEIHLLQCHRTEKQHFRYDRLNGILIAAMLQSEQTWLPILHEPAPVIDLIKWATQDIKLIAHCEDAPKIPLHKVDLSSNTIILIGPEGDFSTEEINQANERHFVAVSLGNTRLRTETAGVAAATVLMLR
jgi:16S rRNA (uracil1498-N3)-methyltransferase